MRVISQDGRISINPRYKDFWRQSEFIYSDCNGSTHVFGKYHSEERAKEVFEDLNTKIILDAMNVIYKMPQE